MLRVWSCAILVVVGGCRLSFDKAEHGGGFPPRANSEARAALYASSPELAAMVLAALRANPTLAQVELLDDSAADTERHERCRQLAIRGVDYLLYASGGVEFDRSFVCDRYDYDLLDMKADSECVDGHWEDERATARFDLTVIDTGFCSPAPGVHAVEVIAGPEESSRPEAEALVARMVAHELNELSFPWQARIVAAGAPARAEAPSTDERVAPGLVLATFRGRDYLGLSRAESIPGAGLGVTPMSCCFSLQPGDVVQQRDSYHLIDVGLGAAAASLSAEGRGRRLAAGAYWHLRRYRIGGGFVGGVSGSTVGADGDRVSIFTLEGGYLFKLVPGLDLAALAGAGVGVAESGDRDQVPGAHLRAAAAFTFNPMPWWYLQLELGALLSSRYGDRLDDGFSLALRTPTATLGLGLEFH